MKTYTKDELNRMSKLELARLSNSAHNAPAIAARMTKVDLIDAQLFAQEQRATRK